MRLTKGIKEVIRNPRKYMVTIVLGVIVIILGMFTLRSAGSRKDLSYTECLDQTAVTVNGQNVTFREAALYVAYEEQSVQEQALVYDMDHTDKYWNLHIDGEFVRVAAKHTTQQMLIHDMIFYQMAMDENLELSEEENQAFENSFYDFWSDLTDEGKEERLGVTEAEIHETMHRMAVAQKYQEIYAMIHEISKEDLDFNGDAYQQLLEDNQYKVNENVWDRLSFGNITLRHDDEI